MRSFDRSQFLKAGGVGLASFLLGKCTLKTWDRSAICL